VSLRNPLSGIVLDEHARLSLHDVCEICGIEESIVVEMVNEGIAEPLSYGSARWEFSGIAVTRLRVAYRLQRDLHVNLAGAALALELLEELETLRRVREGR